MDLELKTHFVADEMCARAGISGRFMSSTNIGVFPSQFVKPSSADAPSAYTANTEAKIFTVRPEVILFHPIIRRLLNQACGIFVGVQSMKPTDDFVYISIQYRSVIRACLENLQEEVMRVSGAEKEELMSHITIFYSIECMWHLCELLYMQESFNNMVGYKLINWVRFHIPKYERATSQLLKAYAGSAIDARPEYWPTVVGCLLQGRVGDVCTLLGMHADASSLAMRTAAAALHAMPTFACIVEGLSLSEFNLRRKAWLVDTQAKIDAQVFAGESQLNLIMRLVVGEELAWSEVCAQCEVWYELLAAWLFYTDPTVHSYELPVYAKKCIRQMRTTVKHIDMILLAAMEMDAEFLKQIQTMNESGWFITHFVDLMYHARLLGTWKIGDRQATQLRESLVLEYGTLLMGHYSLWQIGLNYLDHCPKHGAAAIALLLPRVARNPTKARKAMQEATKRRMYTIFDSLAKIQSLNAIRHERLGNALIWGMKAKDLECITHLTYCMLMQYRTSYVLPHQDLLTNFGIAMLSCDSLMFAAKYYDFRQAYDGRNYAEAANIIVGLIGSKITPEFFWSVLFCDTLNLLNCQEHVIDAKESLIIMNCLEEKAKQTDLKEKLLMIRIALAKNISKVYAQKKLKL